MGASGAGDFLPAALWCGGTASLRSSSPSGIADIKRWKRPGESASMPLRLGRRGLFADLLLLQYSPVLIVAADYRPVRTFRIPMASFKQMTLR
jgi:hypothetical protein